MTSAPAETTATDYTDAYEDSSAWCHTCNMSKPPLDRPSNASRSGVEILKVGTAWDCPACGSHWVVARIEEVGLRWMTTGTAE